jgi:hypothetical protein
VSITEQVPPVEVQDSDVEHFRANGYFRLEQITTAEEVEHLRDLYDKVMGDSSAWRLVYEGAEPDGAVIDQVFLPELQQPGFADTGYLRNAKRIAARFFGVEESEVTPGGLMLIHKPPTGGRAAPWHQDEAFWDDKSHLKCNSLSVWMPLDDVVVESGAMQFLPGSHRNDVLRHRSEPGEPLFLDEDVDLSTAVACPLPAGGATFHHCRTLHHTAENTSGRPRRAMTTIFHGPHEVRPEPLAKPWITGLEAPTQRKV